MATVPELKAQANKLKLKYPSKILKADLELLIAKALFPAPVAQAETEAERMERAHEIWEQLHSEGVRGKALAARVAGAMGKSAEPMGDYSRLCAYVDQRRLANEGRSTLACRSLLTPRQNRRMEKKKANRTKASV